MIWRAKAFAGSRAGRILLLLGFLAGGVATAALFPVTPDEVARIKVVRNLLAGEPYSWYWPPGNILAILANPLFHAGVPNDLVAVRFFNFLLAAIPVCLLIVRSQRPGLLLLLPLLMPYAWLVMSTASQQGLMIALLIALLWSIVADRPFGVFLAAAALYFVNPAMIAVVPAVFIALAALGRLERRHTLAALAAILPMAVLVLAAWAATGTFRPTLSENGPVNLWIGNNPHPLSHRGVAYEWGGDVLAATVRFATEDPVAFIANLWRKAWLYWMPWDYLRSGMGSGLQPLVFAYIAMAQATIYAAVFVNWRRVDGRVLAIALALAVLAWLLYTAFFVKIRFRVPFDLLLFVACLLPASTAGSGANRSER